MTPPATPQVTLMVKRNEVFGSYCTYRSAKQNVITFYSNLKVTYTGRNMTY